MPFMPGQTAVIIEIAQAQHAVGSWRARFDNSAGLGVPPHVTIVFPFVPLAELTAGDRADLAGLVAAEPAFTTTFASFGMFPATGARPPVLYLEPSPDEPFRRLTAALVARWPGYRPYGGAYADLVPHLTITETAAPDQVRAARRAVADALPVAAAVETVRLIDFDGARWRRNATFPLGSGPE